MVNKLQDFSKDDFQLASQKPAMNDVNGQFSLSGGLVEKLSELGILDLAVSIGTWVVRVKTFLQGIRKGFKKGFNFIRKITNSVFGAINKVLKAIGFNVKKNTSSFSAWGKAGKIAGMAIVVILGLIAASLLVVAVNSLLAFLPMIVIIGLVGLAIWALIKAIGWAIDLFLGIWDLGGQLFQAGKDMVYAIWDGMKSVWGSFSSWLSSKLKEIPILGTAIEYMEGGGGTVRALDQAVNQAVLDGTITQKEADEYKAQKEQTDNSVMNQGADNNAGAVQSMKDRAQSIKNAIEIHVTSEIDGDVIGKAVATYNEDQESRE